MKSGSPNRRRPSKIANKWESISELFHVFALSVISSIMPIATLINTAIPTITV